MYIIIIILIKSTQGRQEVVFPLRDLVIDLDLPVLHSKQAGGCHSQRSRLAWTSCDVSSPAVSIRGAK
jgi:hypothetical protein